MDRRPDPSLQGRARLLRCLPPLEEIVRGSLFERRRRCGQPSCHCAREKGHPTFYLAVTLALGKTEQISLPPELVPLVRRWVGNYQRVWDLLEAVSSINRQWIRQEREARKRDARRRRG